MKRTLAAAVLATAVVVAGCSTPVYTSSKAVGDLQRKSGLTQAQAECVVKAISKHFATEIVAKQKANGLTALPADRLKLEVDSALATLRTPTGSEDVVAHRAVATCAPAFLR